MKTARSSGPRYEIAHVQTNADGSTEVIDRIVVLPHLIKGANQLCRVLQDDYDKKALPVRVYLCDKDNVPLYAAYGVERNPRPALKKAS